MVTPRRLPSAAGVTKAQPSLIAIPAEPTPKPRLQKGMTHKKLCQRIRLGHGMGHGSGYLPWLILRRNNPSPYSNQVATSMPPLRRGAYYYSRACRRRGATE